MALNSKIMQVWEAQYYGSSQYFRKYHYNVVYTISILSQIVRVRSAVQEPAHSVVFPERLMFCRPCFPRRLESTGGFILLQRIFRPYLQGSLAQFLLDDCFFW